MKSQDIENALQSALTQFDAKELARTGGSRAKGYNPNALGIYFNRVADIVADIEAGATPRAAIVAGLTGKVQAVCLKALGLDKQTEAERTGAGAWHYVPASERDPAARDSV